MKTVNQGIPKKYFNALNELKNEIESGNFVNATKWQSNARLSHRTTRVLKNLGIVKNLGSNKFPVYEWNNRIPVTMMLAKKVILENSKLQSTYNEACKSNLKKITPILTKKPHVNLKQKPLVKQVIKSIPITKKVSDVGLIRKFFKWIY